MALRNRPSGVVVSLVAVSVLGVSCSPSTPPADSDTPPAVYRGEVRFGLSFEQRMALPPKLSQLKAEAGRRADEVYDPFKSRENAVRNEAMAHRLFTSSKESLLTELDLTEAQLDEIIREYQASLGANIR